MTTIREPADKSATKTSYLPSVKQTLGATVTALAAVDIQSRAPVAAANPLAQSAQRVVDKVDRQVGHAKLAVDKASKLGDQGMRAAQHARKVTKDMHVASTGTSRCSLSAWCAQRFAAATSRRHASAFSASAPRGLYPRLPDP